MILKHRNMKDVAFEVTEYLGLNVVKGCWINLLGTYEHSKPFHMGSGRRLAIETLTIPNRHEWKVYSDAKSAKDGTL